MADGVSFPSGDDVGAFVLDLGGLYVRAGNAGDDCPKQYWYSAVGQQTQQQQQPSVTAVPGRRPSQDGTSMTEMSDVGKRGGGGGKKRPRSNSTGIGRRFPLTFSALTNNLKVVPTLYQSSKKYSSFGFPTSLSEILAAPGPLSLDAEAFETTVEGLFGKKSGLGVNLKGRPVLLTEPSKHNRNLRERMAEIMFEAFSVEAVYTAKRSVLSAFAAGRSGGCVVDIGTSSTVITPVQDGFTLQRKTIELPIAGDLLDHQLLAYLREAALEKHVTPIFAVKKVLNKSLQLDRIEAVDLTHCEATYQAFGSRETLRRMKECSCRVAEIPLRTNDSAPSSMSAGPGVNRHIGSHGYELPDGTVVPTDEVSRAVPECLFDFSRIRDDIGKPIDLEEYKSVFKGYTNIAAAILGCVQSCDVDGRRELLNGIILTGGTSSFAGLADRLSRQFQEDDKVSGTGLKFKLVSPASSIERRFSTWVGGSILASLASFQQMWMSRAEYEEHGISLLERRCLH